MMLLKDFYSLVDLEGSAGSVRSGILINKNHEIFIGHFPGLPIVPGVCMMQMILEIMQVSTGRAVSLANAESMKFLSVINPAKNGEIQVEINYTEHAGKFSLRASLFAGSVTFFKLRATLTIV